MKSKMVKPKSKRKAPPNSKQSISEKPKTANDNNHRGSSNPTTSTSSSSSSSSRHTDTLLPLPFPSSLSFPSDDFLRNEEPYKKSFQAAHTTAYEGFVVDETVDDEAAVQNALQDLLSKQYFRTDVTQPFGLGTKCAKTYVTRCLLGEPGTTYKYLGLRMFAHPWETTKIHSLAQTLSGRTRCHLKELDDIRRERKAPPTRGRSDFDICLINRMEASEELKPEPTMGNHNNAHKTTVSWHADSSLEHFSTIAVYQTIVSSSSSSSENPKKKAKQTQNNNNKKTKSDNNNQWFVALRVAHNSEGPNASRRGTGIDSSIIKETPPIAANMPSGSAYYLLDDFNHHHQHTVLTNAKQQDDFDSAGVRFSCTYRLLRDSHSVSHILSRGKTVCSNFHKKGSKVWRSEQLLLTEMESEWIRQFYIQGLQHYELLWSVRSLGCLSCLVLL
jgi:alpha-ketoglutarate-dependent dioxygenase FTO